jgi:hypothetical protein
MAEKALRRGDIGVRSSDKADECLSSARESHTWPN